jgi:hypothetical protein
MKLVEENEGRLLGERKKLGSKFFMIIRMCGVTLEFHSNNLGVKVDLDFFLS